MNQFISQFNLNEGWHPGAMEQNDQGFWWFRQDWAYDMDKVSKKADLMYLRSVDQKMAIGVITNKTVNVETTDGCLEENSWQADFNHLLSNEDGETHIEARDEGLKLRNMKSGKYIIEYYNPHNPTQIISTSEDNGPKVKIEFGLDSNTYDYLILFKAYKKNDKSIDEEDEQEDLENEDNEISNFLDDDINIYPNPSNDIVNIASNEELSLEIYDNYGKLIRIKEIEKKMIAIDISTFENGIYFFKLIKRDNTTVIKKIMKL